jgi:hypothetical protein
LGHLSRIHHTEAQKLHLTPPLSVLYLKGRAPRGERYSVVTAMPLAIFYCDMYTGAMSLHQVTAESRAFSGR